MKRKLPIWFFMIVVILVQACSLVTCPLSQLLPVQATDTPSPTRTPRDPTATPAATLHPTLTTTTMISDPGADDDPFLGPEDAVVTIVGFSDFSCGFCRRFNDETLPILLQMYPDELRYVHRDFPIVGGGAVGYAAAQAANCANEQDAYWEYHDGLFSGFFSLNRDGYAQIADNLGLDSAALLQCLDSERYIGEVLHDWQEGSILGVSGTPTFFINGIPVIGAQDLDVFTQIIDSELGR